MSRRMRASAVLALLAAVVALGACGTSSESSSAAVCPAPPAASPTSSGSDSVSGSPDAPKLTALEIAQRLPFVPSTASDTGLFGEEWAAGVRVGAYTRTPELEARVLSSAERNWYVRPIEGLFGGAPSGGAMRVRVYDSPAARVTAERSVPQGGYRDTLPGTAVALHPYRCFTSCGAVAVEVWAEESGNAHVAWANAAVRRTQTGLEQVFGGCPTWEDVGVPPSEVSP
jgi:hypothetical protein